MNTSHTTHPTSDSPLHSRDRADQCPGVLALHQANDGAIGRLRFPGGHISGENLAHLGQLAKDHGDGYVHVTMRGNVQIRGIHNPDAFQKAVTELGLLPHPTHDKIRNIIASPYTPRELITQLDEALCAVPEIGTLSGRTLFGIDDGQGDILAEKPDFSIHKDALYLAGEFAGRSSKNPVELIVEAAKLWAEHRGKFWRVHEHPEFLPLVQEKLALDTTNPPVLPAPENIERYIGWFDIDGHVDLGAGLPFGILPAETLGVIGKDISLSPWRTILIHNLDESEAEAVVRFTASRGLVYDAHSPWLDITACTGTPGCAKSLSDVRRDARALIDQRLTGEPVPEKDRRVHFVGCARRCGRPNGHYLEYLATGEGEYETIYR
ncbi:MAG: precorrin-3B synthase [Corynebacterium sp.]|nr:precorrin-3B synthase [Corynebacterium sp.]